jgi:hypothetical protein
MIESIGFYYLLPEQIVFDEKVFGYCKLPYPDHKHGCPNLGKCLHPMKEAWEKVQTAKQIRLYMAKFDLEKHVTKMKEKNPTFTDKQAKCVLYWQNTVKKTLKTEIEKDYQPEDYVLGCGSGFNINGKHYNSMEAAGIHIFKTFENNRIPFEAKPVKIVTMAALLVKPRHLLKPNISLFIQHKLF